MNYLKSWYGVLILLIVGSYLLGGSQNVHAQEEQTVRLRDNEKPLSELTPQELANDMQTSSRSPDGSKAEFVPKLIKGNVPPIPEWARRRSISGLVIYDVFINNMGEVTDVQILESPHAVYSKAVIDGLKNWKFEPFENPGKEGAIIRGSINYGLEP